MRKAWFKADLKIIYPAPHTHQAVRAMLRRMARLSPGREDLPWPIVPRFPHLLHRPEPRFDYATVILFCLGESARRILTPRTQCEEHLIDAIVRYRPQFPAIFHEHLVHWTRSYLVAKQLPGLPDCAGRAPTGRDESCLAAEDVAANRRVFLHILERASMYYERLLGLLYCADSPEERASGHELHHWITGADMPGAVLVPVAVLDDRAPPLITPSAADAKPIVQAGWRVPRYRVRRNMIMDDDAPPPPAAMAEQRSPARPVRIPLITLPMRDEVLAAPAFAVEGERYAIAADWTEVIDRQTGERRSIESPGVQCALRAFAEHANGRDTAKTTQEIKNAIGEQRVRMKLREVRTYEIIHHFQRKVRGKRVTSPLFRLLIRRVGKQGLWWLAL